MIYEGSARKTYLVALRKISTDEQTPKVAYFTACNSSNFVFWSITCMFYNTLHATSSQFGLFHITFVSFEVVL